MASYSVEAILRAVDQGFSSTLAAAERQLSAFQNSSQTGAEMLGNLGAAMTKTGAVATVGLTTPLVAGAKQAMSTYANFDDSMRRVSATIGDGAKVGSDAYKQLEKQAQDLGASTRHSATDVADGMNYMAMAGWKTEQIMAGVPSVLNLATASGLDLASTSDIVTDALTAFGMKAEDTARFSDVLAATSANANTNVGIMGESFKYVAPVAGALGYTAEDTALAIGIMANSGIKATQAGTSLRAGLVNLANPTKKMSKAMDAYGLSITDSEGNMKSFRNLMTDLRTNLNGLAKDEQAAAAASIFGKEAMSGWLAIINASDEDFEKLAKSIDESEGATQQMVETMDSGIGGAFASFRSAVEGVYIALGKQLTPVIQPLIEKVTSMLQAFATASPEVQQSAIKMGMFAAAIGPALVAAGKLTGVMGDIWGVTGQLAGGMTSFAGNAKGAFSGLGQVVSNFGKDVGSIVATALPKLTNGLGIAFDFTKSKAISTFGGIQSKIGATFSAIGSKLSIFQITMGDTFSKIGEFGGRLSSVLGQSFNLMTSIIQRFAGVAMNALMPAAIFGVFLVGLGLLQTQFGEQIEQMAQVAITQGPTIISNLTQGIVSRIPDLIAQGAQLIETFTEVIVANAPSVIQGAVALISALVQGVGANASSLISSAVQIIGVFVDGILSALPQLLSVGMQFLVQLAQGVISNVPLILSTALRIVQNFVQSVTSAAPAILSSGVQLIVTLVTGLIQNLPQIISTGAEIITSLVSGIAQLLPQIALAGLELVIKLVFGIIQGLPQIIEAGWELIKGFFTAIYEGIVAFGQGVVDGVKGLWDRVTGKAKEGTTEVKFSVDDMASHTTAKTAEMQQVASLNTATMSSDILANFRLASNGGMASIDQLSANVNTSTAGIAEAGATGSQSFMDSITGNLANANATGTAEAQALANNINAATSALDVPTQADLTSYFNAVSSNTTNATDTATAQADAMANNVNTATGKVGAGATDAMTAYNSAITNGMNQSTTTAVSQAQQMQTGVDAFLQQMGSTVDSTMASITSKITSGMTQASNQTKSQADAIANAIKSGFDRAKSSVDSSMSSITSSFDSGTNKVKSTATSTTNQLLNIFKTTFTNLKSATTSMMSAVTNSVQSGMQRILSVSQSTGSQMVTTFMALQGQMVSAGAYAGQGFASGLATQEGAIMSVAQNIAQNVSETIRSALDIHSPSRVTRQLGGWTGEGFYLGLQDWEGKVEDMSEALAESALPNVDTFDLATNLGSMPSAVSHSGVVTVSHKPQPLQLSLSMGREDFGLFVEDIFNMHDRQERYRLRSSSI